MYKLRAVLRHLRNRRAAGAYRRDAPIARPQELPLVIDAPEAERAVEYRGKDARVRVDLVKIEEIVNAVDADLEEFELPVDAVDEVRGAHDFVETADLEKELQQDRQEVGDQLERDDDELEGGHQDGPEDDTAGDKHDGEREAAAVFAEACEHLGDGDEVLQAQECADGILEGHMCREHGLCLEDFFDEGVRAQDARDDQQDFEDDREECDVYVPREVVEALGGLHVSTRGRFR